MRNFRHIEEKTFYNLVDVKFKDIKVYKFRNYGKGAGRVHDKIERAVEYMDEYKINRAKINAQKILRYRARNYKSSDRYYTHYHWIHALC
jgi:hypothetical protein